MALNGSGVYLVNSAGQPVVANTLITAAAFNAFTSDIATALSTAIFKDGQQTVTANIPFGGFALTGVGSGNASRTRAANTGDVQDDLANWCGTAGGTADALTLTPTPAITAYVAGQRFTFKAGASANTTNVTVAISSLATKAIQKNGAALVAGNIAANMWYRITYDGAAFQLEQISPAEAGLLMTGAINTARATVASAATTSAIWAAAANEIDFTGTATITDFPAAPQAGATRTLICAGACVFTHAGNISVQGAANYTAAAGDVVTIHALTTTTFRVDIKKADGTAVVASDASITTTDITTNDASTTKHGWCPKGPNTGKFLRDDITWQTVSAGSTITAGSVATQNPFSGNTVVTTAHGLGAQPKWVNAYLQCLTAELGYSIGDRIYIGNGEGNAQYGISISSDTTNIYISTNNGGGPYLINRAGGTTINLLTAANWKVVVEPYKYA